MATVTFTGTVTAQAAPNETVTITVTKPDSTTDVITATTTTALTFSTTRVYSVAGSYSAKAHIDADAQWKASDSVAVPFTISLQDRSITLTVQVT